MPMKAAEKSLKRSRSRSVHGSSSTIMPIEEEEKPLKRPRSLSVEIIGVQVSPERRVGNSSIVPPPTEANQRLISFGGVSQSSLNHGSSSTSTTTAAPPPPNNPLNFVLERPCCLECAKRLNGVLAPCNRTENKGPCNNCTSMFGLSSGLALISRQCRSLPNRFIPRVNQLTRYVHRPSGPPENFEQLQDGLMKDIEDHECVALTVGLEVLENLGSVLEGLTAVVDLCDEPEVEMD